ncbi:unnamed protein product, partial [Ectocarpus sp. 12 AP-2014]
RGERWLRRQTSRRGGHGYGDDATIIIITIPPPTASSQQRRAASDHAVTAPSTGGGDGGAAPTGPVPPEDTSPHPRSGARQQPVSLPRAIDVPPPNSGGVEWNEQQ